MIVLFGYVLSPQFLLEALNLFSYSYFIFLYFLAFLTLSMARIHLNDPFDKNILSRFIKTSK